MVRPPLLAALGLLAACHGGSPQTTPPDAGDPGPAFTVAERAQLDALSPQTLPAPPADSSNRFADNPRAALLGQRLFFEPLFSGRLLDGDNDGSSTTLGMAGQTGRVACAGCHVPSAGFLDNRSLGKQVSLAAGWGLRRTPSLLDVAQARLLMWDGRQDAFYNQALGPLESSQEMNSSRLYVAEQIARLYRPAYEEIFGPLPPLAEAAHFPQLDASQTGCDRLQGGLGPPVCHGRPGDGAEYDGLAAADQEAVTRVVVNAGKALGAYLRRLSCGPGRFDRWAHGDSSALTASEQRGAQLFVGKANCASCHSGPYLSDEKFHNVGLAPATVAVVFTDTGDRGAGLGFAQALANPLNVRSRFSDGDDGRLPKAPGPDQEGAFRTPGLRCLGRRPSFMHTAQLSSIADVVAFFDGGGHPFGYPGKSELVQLGLSAGERRDLAAFLGTLNGPGPEASLLVSP